MVSEAEAGVGGERDLVIGQDGDDVLHAGAADPPVRKLGVQAGAHAAGGVRRRGVTDVRGVGEAAAAAVQQDRRLERDRDPVVERDQPRAPVREAGNDLGDVRGVRPRLRERGDASAQPRHVGRDELGGRQHVRSGERDEGHGVRMPQP